MSAENDLEIIESQPPVKIWGEDFEDIDSIKAYKGKFVMTEDGKLFAKLYPMSEWGNIELFHDMVVSELGVKDAESMDVKDMIIGGGKIEIELIENHIECRLYGKSTIYGDYDADAVDITALEMEIREVFELDEIPVLVIPDYEE